MKYERRWTNENFQSSAYDYLQLAILEVMQLITSNFYQLQSANHGLLERPCILVIHVQTYRH